MPVKQVDQMMNSITKVKELVHVQSCSVANMLRLDDASSQVNCLLLLTGFVICLAMLN